MKDHVHSNTDVLDSIVLILVEPRLAVNIGTVVRAMKNMGLTNIRLVNPAPMDLQRTQISAHRSMDVVEKIERFDTLEEAIEDCHHLIGMTARLRKASWETDSPRARAPQLIQRLRSGQKIGLLFGREASGLSNEELDRCHELLTIPTRSDYSSLNLSQAVLLLCYELRLAATSGPVPQGTSPKPSLPEVPKEVREVATAGMHARLFAQIEHTLAGIRFFKSKSPEGIMRTLRRILHRAEMNPRELRTLTGIFAEVLKFAHLIQRGIIEPLPPALVQMSDQELLELENKRSLGEDSTS